MSALSSPATAPTESGVAALLATLPATHALAAGPIAYRDGFIRAFLQVHSRDRDWLQVLRQKFFVSNNTNYSTDRFLQHAAELSVANHIATRAPVAFATERNMNPGIDERDVDVYYEVGATRVALEVKCPEERPVNPDESTLDFAGRHPDPDGIFKEIAAVLARQENLPPERKQLKLTQHKDNKLKDYLVSAHSKFSVTPAIDDLNVLLVAGGEELQPWHSYLHERQGLFTPQSFYPTQEYARTQILILSNLKYFHTLATAHHDWTLRDVFLLPVLNPRAGTIPMSATYSAGLSVFEHHLQAFQTFRPVTADPRVDREVVNALKLNTYIHGKLSDADFQRYFPCTKRRGSKG